MKIGILGGAFNPPHLGHIALARDVARSLKLDKIFFIPTSKSPHKENDSLGPLLRYEMVKLAIAGEDGFELKDDEIKRGGISFTVDTVKGLKKDYPRDEFYLIVGSDLAGTFSTWKEFAQLRRLAKIVVACRNNYPLPSKAPACRPGRDQPLAERKEDDFILVNITQVDASSSQVRKLVRVGKPIESFVDRKVADYIKKNNLYGREAK